MNSVAELVCGSGYGVDWVAVGAIATFVTALCAGVIHRSAENAKDARIAAERREREAREEIECTLLSLKLHSSLLSLLTCVESIPGMASSLAGKQVSADVRGVMQVASLGEIVRCAELSAILPLEVSRSVVVVASWALRLQEMIEVSLIGPTASAAMGDGSIAQIARTLMAEGRPVLFALHRSLYREEFDPMFLTKLLEESR